MLHCSALTQRRQDLPTDRIRKVVFCSDGTVAVSESLRLLCSCISVVQILDITAGGSNALPYSRHRIWHHQEHIKVNSGTLLSLVSFILQSQSF
jgi:hypothetical protein